MSKANSDAQEKRPPQGEGAGAKGRANSGQGRIADEGGGCTASEGEGIAREESESGAKEESEDGEEGVTCPLAGRVGGGFVRQPERRSCQCPA